MNSDLSREFPYKNRIYLNNASTSRMPKSSIEMMKEFTKMDDPVEDESINDTLPWIEKFRPKTLDDVISHGQIIATFKKFITKNQVLSVILKCFVFVFLYL